MCVHVSMPQGSGAGTPSIARTGRVSLLGVAKSDLTLAFILRNHLMARSRWRVNGTRGLLDTGVTNAGEGKGNCEESSLIRVTSSQQMYVVYQ